MGVQGETYRGESKEWSGRVSKHPNFEYSGVRLLLRDTVLSQHMFRVSFSLRRDVWVYEESVWNVSAFSSTETHFSMRSYIHPTASRGANQGSLHLPGHLLCCFSLSVSVRPRLLARALLGRELWRLRRH
jgi:hypothetical protein